MQTRYQFLAASLKDFSRYDIQSSSLVVPGFLDGMPDFIQGRRVVECSLLGYWRTDTIVVSITIYSWLRRKVLFLSSLYNFIVFEEHQIILPSQTSRTMGG